MSVPIAPTRSASRPSVCANGAQVSCVAIAGPAGGEVQMRDSWRRILVQGMTAGLIGFVTVALMFAVVNVSIGRSPFYTSALLGAALFYGASDPAQVAVTPATVLAYSGLHLLVFLAFGVVAAALSSMADRGKQLWYVALFFFIFLAFHLEGAVQLFAAPMRPVLSDGAIWSAGIAGAVAMIGYLLWQHPKIRARQAW